LVAPRQRGGEAPRRGHPDHDRQYDLRRPGRGGARDGVHLVGQGGQGRRQRHVLRRRHDRPTAHLPGPRRALRPRPPTPPAEAPHPRGGRLTARRQPFTLPAVSPATIYFWRQVYAAMTGRVVSTAPATRKPRP